MESQDNQARNQIDMLKEKILKIINENKHLFGQSKNKDIVIFLGLTGSGKSTAINYLIGKKMKVVDCKKNRYGILSGGQIILENENDIEAMKMSKTSISVTTFPQQAICQYQNFNFQFFDLAGLGDTRGYEQALTNLIFTKDIFQNAKSLKVVIVIQQSDIENERGQPLIRLKNQMVKLFKCSLQDLQKFSCCLITKGEYELKEQINIIEDECKDLFSPWIENNKIQIFPNHNNGQIEQKHRIEILKLIQQLERFENFQVDFNVSDLFNYEESNKIQQLYDREIDYLFQKIYNSIYDFTRQYKAYEYQNIISQVQNIMEQCNKKEQSEFKERFQEESQLIQILNIVSIKIYVEQLQQQQQVIFKNLKRELKFIEEQYQQILTQEISEKIFYQLNQFISDIQIDNLNQNQFVKQFRIFCENQFQQQLQINEKLVFKNAFEQNKSYIIQMYQKLKKYNFHEKNITEQQKNDIDELKREMEKIHQDILLENEKKYKNQEQKLNQLQEKMNQDNYWITHEQARQIKEAGVGILVLGGFGGMGYGLGCLGFSLLKGLTAKQLILSTVILLEEMDKKGYMYDPKIQLIVKGLGFFGRLLFDKCF